MINIETAKQLKDLGIQWEPQVGDVYGFTWQSPLSSAVEDTDIVVSTRGFSNNMKGIAGLKNMYTLDNVYWIPSLASLIAEVNKIGFKWELTPSRFSIVENRGPFRFVLQNFENASQEQAVADGLLWLIQNKK